MEISDSPSNLLVAITLLEKLLRWNPDSLSSSHQPSLSKVIPILLLFNQQIVLCITPSRLLKMNTRAPKHDFWLEISTVVQSPWCDTDGRCALHSGPSASFLFFRVSEEELNDYRIWTKSLIASMIISRALVPYSTTSNVPDEDSTSGQVPEWGWLWTQLPSTQNEHGALRSTY